MGVYKLPEVVTQQRPTDSRTGIYWSQVQSHTYCATMSAYHVTLCITER